VSTDRTTLPDPSNFGSHVLITNASDPANNGVYEVQVVPVVLEGLPKPVELTGPNAHGEFWVQVRLDDGTTVRTRVGITYTGMRSTGAPVLRVTAKMDVEEPFKKATSDGEGYDGPVVNRGR
jgi:hypothetical protein